MGEILGCLKDEVLACSKVEVLVRQKLGIFLVMLLVSLSVGDVVVWEGIDLV